MSEEETTPSESTGAAEPAAPMNRAERRAAAKGKKAPQAAHQGMGGLGSNRAAQSHAAGGTRLPRTGHKGG